MTTSRLSIRSDYARTTGFLTVYRPRSLTLIRRFWIRTGATTDFVNGPQTDNNHRANYGPADFSIKQRLVMTPIWVLPFGKGQPFLNQGGVTNALAGGWELSGIIT